MKCRKCGQEIPERLLKRDAFKCPICGNVYRKKPDASRNVQRQRKKKGFNLRILKKKIWKLPLWAWILIALFLVAGVDEAIKDDGVQAQPILTTQPSLTSESNVLNTESPTEIPTLEPIEEPIGDLFENAASKVLPKDYISEYSDDRTKAKFTFYVEGWNEEWTIKSFKNKVSDYCEYLCNLEGYENLNYSTLYFVGNIGTVDIYGNTGTQVGLQLAIDKTAIDKIQWDRFLWENISTIGHDYYESPLLQK